MFCSQSEKTKKGRQSVAGLTNTVGQTFCAPRFQSTPLLASLCAVNSRPATALWGTHRQLLGPQRPCLGVGQQCFHVKSAQMDVSAGGHTDPIMCVPITPAGGLAGATSRPLTASGSTPIHMSLSPLSGATNTLPLLPLVLGSF